VQIISGSYFDQHNDGDGDKDGDKVCGDELGMGTTSRGWDGVEMGMLVHPHVTLFLMPETAKFLFADCCSKAIVNVLRYW